MLDYTIKVLLFQTLFLAVYDLILKRETFFQWNRAYLIVTSMVAYVIPLLKIDKIYEVIPQEYVVLLPEVLLSPSTVIEESVNWSTLLFTGLTYLFWIGVISASLLFVRRLYKVVSLIYKNEKEQKPSYNLVKLEDNNAFSFFNYIFLGKTLSEENKQQIITHELVHVRQKHSVDLLLFEVQKILFWFNPFSYLFQKRIAEIHEFIADSKAIKEIDRKDYFQNLLAQTFGTYKISFINPFLKFSLIKKRIVMLNKNKSKQFLKFKYLLMLPLLVSMLLYSSCDKDAESQQSLKNNEKRLTTLFLGSLDGSETKEIQSKKESYFDMYMLGAKPSGKEISYDDLTVDEKLELDNLINAFEVRMGKGAYTHKIYEDASGKKSLKEIIHWDVIKSNSTKDNYANANEVPFAVIDKSPIFPGCEDAIDKKKCFIEKMNEFIVENFDISIAENLGLESGKKKIYAKFSVADDGRITYVKVRAPNVKLEDAVFDLLYDLPNMVPGEHNGKKVEVTYMQPISFNIQ